MFGIIQFMSKIIHNNYDNIAQKRRNMASPSTPQKNCPLGKLPKYYTCTVLF